MPARPDPMMATLSFGPL
uniref:Uncharacterized protein n=1 Tax=Arundo donax TaxID=35708 RepID=A0A0A9GBY7_ARUDO